MTVVSEDSPRVSSRSGSSPCNPPPAEAYSRGKIHVVLLHVRNCQSCPLLAFDGAGLIIRIRIRTCISQCHLLSGHQATQDSNKHPSNDSARWCYAFVGSISISGIFSQSTPADHPRACVSLHFPIVNMLIKFAGVGSPYPTSVDAIMYLQPKNTHWSSSKYAAPLGNQKPGTVELELWKCKVFKIRKVAIF